MIGWVKIHRQLTDHWIFNDPVKFRWWIIILFEANYKPNKMLLGNMLYDVHPGQCTLSIRTWAIKFGVGTKSVESFFKLLEKDGMITRKTIGKGKHSTTLINIENYAKYQVIEETQGGTQKGTQRKRKGSTTKEDILFNNNISEELEETKKIPDLYEFLDYLKFELTQFNYSSYEFPVKSKYESWVDNGWRDGNNKDIINWKLKLKNTITHLKPINNGTKPSNSGPTEEGLLAFING